MTHRRAGTGSIGVVLPADWHVVDLTNDTTRHADVTALVDRQVPRRDDLATVRRRLRREVEDASRRAAQAGGRFSAYMLTAGPVPLPAVLTAYRTPGSLAADADLDALATTLSVRAGAAGTVDAGDGPLGPVLRTVTERGGRTGGTGPDGAGGDAVTDEGGTELLVCDYWSDPDDGDGLLVLSFSTPLLPLRDALLTLFDTIAGSAHRAHDGADTDRGERACTEPRGATQTVVPEGSEHGVAPRCTATPGAVTNVRAPHTDLPTDVGRDEIAEVRSSLAAHAGRGGTVEPRYLLVGSAEGDQLELPRPIDDALVLVAESLASGKGVTVAPESQLLTTQQVADLLGVSRPTVVRLTDAGELPSERHGNRRRIRLGDVLAYRERRRHDQYEALGATAVGLDEEDDVADVVARLRTARREVAARRRAARQSTD